MVILFQILGIISLVIGFFMGTSLGEKTGNVVDCLPWWLGSFMSAIVLFAFSSVFKELQKIREKLDID